MPKKVDRVSIDTNLWISFLLTGNYSRLDILFADNQLTLLFSQELLEEFIEVSQRPKFKNYFDIADLQLLVLQIKERAEFIQVETTVTVCRDPKDNFLLALAQDGKATHLITGDKDLLDVKTFGETKILTIAEYLEKR
jgi:hypothetical protein